MIKIRKGWWKNFFNHIYLITDSRSVCDDELTSREVDFIEEILSLKKTDRILDLFGGQGRHLIELAKRGYQDLTVLDYSNFLIVLGKRLAEKDDLKINFNQGDARSTELKSRDYSAIIVMANSFGYFPEEKENLQVLNEANRLLKNKGKFLIDLTNPQYSKDFKPTSWHQIGDAFVIRKRETENLIKVREVVISKKEGLLRDECYCMRIYNKARIQLLLKKAGFKNIKIKNNVSLHSKKGDYGSLTSRMFVIATK